jgi:hypothetical protein
MEKDIKPTIFISGSVETTREAEALASLVASDAVPFLWADSITVSGRASESLFELLRSVDFAAALLPQSVVSPNVFFELGLFVATLGPSRVFVIAPKSDTVRIPSDLAGLLMYSYSPSQDLRGTLSHIATQITENMIRLGSRREKPGQSSSCFISYSANDRKFADKLGEGLEEAGIRAWIDVKDIKIGDRWTDQIDKAMTMHDKVLLVLSRQSVQSQWVRYEVEKALEIERARKTSFLVPIRIDDAIFEVQEEWGAQVREKQIGDFRGWEDSSRFNRSIARLARDLMISAAVEARARSSA